MKLIFEVHTYPGSFELEDSILNTLNDDGLRKNIEVALISALESIMWFDGIQIKISVKLKEWI